MKSLYLLVDTVLGLYLWTIILYVIMSWLIAFNVINTYNRFVSTVGGFLHRLTEPGLRPIRGILPVLGGIDLAPLALLLLIWFARNLLWEYWGSAV
ncbi:MAG: YggT family protein [Kiloniellaceae bacterium]